MANKYTIDQLIRLNKRLWLRMHNGENPMFSVVPNSRTTSVGLTARCYNETIRRLNLSASVLRLINS